MAVRLNTDFVRLLSEAVGHELSETILYALENTNPSVSVRFNPVKVPSSSIKEDLFSNLGDMKKVDWAEYGFVLGQRPNFTLDPNFHSGSYYVQDSSAMIVGHFFRESLKRIPDLGRPIRVLDLCAAPGGKTTDISSSLREIYGDDFILVSNEVVRQRASVLCDNVAIWGDPNVVVTSVDPKVFSRLEGFFDIIVADVPCSGEGMFRKDEDAVAQWSVDNVNLCASRQRRIISDVLPALSEGGILIYATCTFNRQENEDNVAWFVHNLNMEYIDIEVDFPGPVKKEYGYGMYPGRVPGEGQYCSVLSNGNSVRPYRFPKSKGRSYVKNPGTYFTNEMKFVDKGEFMVAIPSNIISETDCIEPLKPLMTGTAFGTFKGGKLVPHADLALCQNLDYKAFEKAELERETALAYLHKDTVILRDFPQGLILATYGGRGLGFLKNLGNRCNNLFPMNRRIKMNII